MHREYCRMERSHRLQRRRLFGRRLDWRQIAMCNLMASTLLRRRLMLYPYSQQAIRLLAATHNRCVSLGYLEYNRHADSDRLNITDTASNANSLLLNLRTGGTSRFSVSKSGGINAASGTFGGALTFSVTTLRVNGNNSAV